MRTADTFSGPTDPPAAEPPLSEAAAEAWIPRTCFKNGPPGRIGRRVGAPGGRRRPGRCRALSAASLPALLPHSGSVRRRSARRPLTVEPGGQVELSSRPGTHLCRTPSTSSTRSGGLASPRRPRLGARLVGHGVDPIGRPDGSPTTPVRSHGALLRRLGSGGPTMMCSTASVQVNVEAGDPAAPRLTAPVDPGRGTTTGRGPLGPAARHRPRPGRRLRQLAPSARPADRIEEHPAGGVAAPGPGPHRRPAGPARRGRADRLDPWALDAPLMMIRRDSGHWSAPRGLSFRELAPARSRGRPGPPAAHHRRSRLPPDHPVPARPAARAPGGPVPRRPARLLVDRAAAVIAACSTTPAAADGRWPPAPRPGPVARRGRGRGWTIRLARGGDVAAVAAPRPASGPAPRGSPSGRGIPRTVDARGRSPADDPPASTRRRRTDATTESSDRRRGGMTVTNELSTTGRPVGDTAEPTDDAIRTRIVDDLTAPGGAPAADRGVGRRRTGRASTPG